MQSESNPNRDVLDTIHTIADFNTAYNVELQLSCVLNLPTFMRAYAPTIADVVRKFGAEATKQWMFNQIMTVFSLGVLESSREQLDELVNVMMTKFYGRKITAYIHFCAKCRMREYKISYAAVKLEMILGCVTEYLDNYYTLMSKLGGEYESETKQQEHHDIESWKFIHGKGRWNSYYDSVKRLIKDFGSQGVFKAFNDTYPFDSYHESCSAMLGINCLVVDNRGNIYLVRDRFEQFLDSI